MSSGVIQVWDPKPIRKDIIYTLLWDEIFTVAAKLKVAGPFLNGFW